MVRFQNSNLLLFEEKNIFILNKHLTYYRQLENSASKIINYSQKIGGIEEIKLMIL